jgi:hypothetical protein
LLRLKADPKKDRTPLAIGGGGGSGATGGDAAPAAEEFGGFDAPPPPSREEVTKKKHLFSGTSAVDPSAFAALKKGTLQDTSCRI